MPSRRARGGPPGEGDRDRRAPTLPVERGISSNDQSLGVQANDALRGRVHDVAGALDTWLSEADSVQNNLARFLAQRLWRLAEVVRVGVSERRVGESRVIRVFALVSDDSRATRDRVYAVETEILQRFPQDLFEFQCQLDRDFVTPRDTLVFRREP
jgi:hypothetical protein